MSKSKYPYLHFHYGVISLSDFTISQMYRVTRCYVPQNQKKIVHLQRIKKMVDFNSFRLQIGIDYLVKNRDLGNITSIEMLHWIDELRQKYYALKLGETFDFLAYAEGKIISLEN